jgi:hypothetical protein
VAHFPVSTSPLVARRSSGPSGLDYLSALIARPAITFPSATPHRPLPDANHLQGSNGLNVVEARIF